MTTTARTLLFALVFSSSCLSLASAQVRGGDEERIEKEAQEKLEVLDAETWKKLTRKRADPTASDDERRLQIHDVRDILGMSERGEPANADRVLMIRTMAKQLVAPPSTVDLNEKLGVLVVQAKTREHRGLADFLADFRAQAGRSFEVTLSVFEGGVLPRADDSQVISGTDQTTDISFFSEDPRSKIAAAVTPAIEIKRSMSSRLRTELESLRRRRYVVGWKRESGIEGFAEPLVLPEIREVAEGLKARVRIVPASSETRYYTVELDLDLSVLAAEPERRETDLGPIWAPELREREIKTTVVLPDSGGLILRTDLDWTGEKKAAGASGLEIVLKVEEIRRLAEDD